MPAVGPWLAAVWAGGGVGAFALRAVATLALNMAVAKLTAPKGPRPQELQTEGRSSNPQRVRHLGRVRTSGAIAFWDWAHLRGLPAGGDFAGWLVGVRRLYKLLAVAEGGMTNVVQWYLDGEPVSVDADGYVTTAPWDKGNVRLQFRKGIQGDQWDGGDWPELRLAFPDQWTTDHRMRGVGTILATFDAVSGEDIGEVYSGGEPEVSALIDGAQAYWAGDGASTNSRIPAVHLSDVIANPTYGPMEASDLDLSRLTAARNACTALVPTDGGTRPRYQSGISIALADPVKDTAKKLLDAMGGRAWITNEGKLTVEAGVWIAPTVTIEERHIVEMDYGAGTERIDRITTLVPTYIAPQARWQENPADPVEDAKAIAKWGEGQPKGVDLLAVQHHGQAAHLCRQQLALMNPDRRMRIKLRAFGFRLIGERRVAINIPRLKLVNQPFWIDTLNYDGTNVTVDVLEMDPAAIADNTVEQEGTPPPAPEEVDRGTSAQTLTIDSVEVVTDDGSPYIRIKGSLTAERGTHLLAQYRRSAGGGWTNMTEEHLPGTGYAFRTPGLADLADYDVRVFLGSYQNSSGGRDLIIRSTPVQVDDIDVVANGEPPAAPVLVSQSGSIGGTLTATFMPDLGANYFRTGLYRSAAGGSFASAVLVKWSYDTSSDVTITAPIPNTGARFWLQSENRSKRTSDPVAVGNYPA